MFLEALRKAIVSGIVLPGGVVIQAIEANAQRPILLDQLFAARAVVENGDSRRAGALQQRGQRRLRLDPLRNHEDRLVLLERVGPKVFGEEESRRAVRVETSVVGLEKPTEVRSPGPPPGIDSQHPLRDHDCRQIVAFQRRQPGAEPSQHGIEFTNDGDLARAGRPRIARRRSVERHVARPADAVGAAHDHLQQGGEDHRARAVVVPEFGVSPGPPARPLVEIDVVRRDLRRLDLFGLIMQIDLVGIAEPERRDDADRAVRSGHDAQFVRRDRSQDFMELPLGVDRVMEPDVGDLVDQRVPLAGLFRPPDRLLKRRLLLGRPCRGRPLVHNPRPPVGRPTPAAKRRIRKQRGGHGANRLGELLGLAMIVARAQRQAGVHAQQDGALLDPIGPIGGNRLPDGVFDAGLFGRHGRWIGGQPLREISPTRFGHERTLHSVRVFSQAFDEHVRAKLERAGHVPHNHLRRVELVVGGKGALVIAMLHDAEDRRTRDPRPDKQHLTGRGQIGRDGGQPVSARSQGRGQCLGKRDLRRFPGHDLDRLLRDGPTVLDQHDLCRAGNRRLLCRAAKHRDRNLLALPIINPSQRGP